MPISDLMSQVWNFIFVGVTLVFIVSIISPFLSTSDLGINTMLSDICTQPGGVAVLNDINYDEQTALVQFLTTNNDNRMTYPANTFTILNALYDSDITNMDEAISSSSGLFIERKNHRLLDNCVDNACFCIVRTDMNMMSFDNEFLKYTACFPRLYAYAKDLFDENFVSTGQDGIDFQNAIEATLAELPEEAEAYEIIQCYDLFDDYSYHYGGREGQYFLTVDNNEGNIMTLQEGETSAQNRLYDAITDFYDLTKAGLFSEIVSCSSIPNDNDCFCPSVRGSVMFSTNVDYGTGVFLALAGSKFSNPSETSVSAFVTQLNLTDAACTMDVSGDSQSS